MEVKTQTDNKLKIVSLVWFKVFPPKFGGQKGIVHFEEELANYFDITCICSSDNELPEHAHLKILPLLPAGKIQFVNPFVWVKIYRLIKKENAAVLLLEHPYHGLTARLAQKFLKIKLVLHQHNIEYLRFKKLKKWWWPLLKQFEKYVCKKADLILFKTMQDKATAVETFGIDSAKCNIVPYGIEEHSISPCTKKNIYKQHNIPEHNKLILFAGTLDYEPNAEAVENIYQKLAPLLDKANFSYTILICGRNKFKKFAYLQKLQHPNIIQVGEVENIEDYFKAADVFINPVLQGGGIQTKVLDALSYHLSVVCFEQTLPGIPKKICEEKLLPVAKANWRYFAERVKEAILQAPAQTPEAFFFYFGWKKITTEVVLKIDNLQ